MAPSSDIAWSWFLATVENVMPTARFAAMNMGVGRLLIVIEAVASPGGDDEGGEFRYDNGVVAPVEASPDGYKETGSFQLATDGHAWAHPVVVGGKLYLREGDSLYCYDVRE